MKGRFLACLWEINNIDVMFQQRKCIVVELRKWPDIDLNDLDPSFTARLP